jgi:hypothetical protein
LKEQEYITDCKCSECNCKSKLGFIGTCIFCQKGDHFKLKRKISVSIWVIRNYFWLKNNFKLCVNCGMRYHVTTSHLPCRFIKI